MTLALPSCGEPELSVVMVTHGAWSLTELAIATLAEHTERPFELLVVDNASEDETRAQLSDLANARVILNEQNRGFGPAANQGARQARGKILVLLNTDAFVHPGWLEPLLDTLSQPGVGAVVPRYLNPDGSLQEAGVLLARDGTVILYGHGDDPDRPWYRFRRRVDYGSAACMLIETATFTALDGFDERYAPAYSEDSDLCMRLAQRGLAVVFDPRSTVTHQRWGSGGFDAATELAERNRRRFVERWRSGLAGRPPTFIGASDQALIAARDVLATPRVLICSGCEEPGVEPLACALVEHWPRSRLTWATETRLANGFDAEGWLAQGVELIDTADQSWLSTRLFHYDAVVRGTEATACLLEEVARTQPQAPQIPLEKIARSPDALLPGLVSALADAGIAPATTSGR